MVKILEKGDIYFLYRPRKRVPHPKGIKGIQRFYIILAPFKPKLYRLVIVGQKLLPEVKKKKGVDRIQWGFVDKISKNPKEVEDEFDPEIYERHIRRGGRPAGEGVYAIAKHKDHAHLVYSLELPEKLGDVQEELNIKKEASYVLSIKNPTKPSPARKGLAPDETAVFPERLQKLFGNRRFITLDRPEFLNYKNAEVLLIGASEDVKKELGLELDPQKENIDTAEIFNNLGMERSLHPLEPLFKGEWG